MLETLLSFGCFSISLMGALAASQLSLRLEAVHEKLLDQRRKSLASLCDPFGVPAVARVVFEPSRDVQRAALPWKRDVVGTIFWVGEDPSQNNPTPNYKSAWDQNWQQNFGGYDDPERRRGSLPQDFTPRLNPFYVALPYNDVAKGGVHRPEASDVIPWFWEAYQGDGISVCKGRWLAIHYKGRVCYAQWEDVGPFEVDHWQYVFGNEPPRPNRNKSAGIDLSPAVRDYLGFRSGEPLEWRFIDSYRVPEGPWLDWSGSASLPNQ